MIRRAVPVLVAVVGLVAAASACDDPTEHVVRVSTSTTGPVETVVPPTTGPEPSSTMISLPPAEPGGELGGGIPAEPPAGFAPATTAEGVEGDVTIDDVRAAFGDEIADQFVASGFVRGVGRSWSSAEPELRIRYVIEFEFASPAQAAALLDPGFLGALTDESVAGTNPLEVTGRQDFGGQPLDMIAVLWTEGSQFGVVWAGGGDEGENRAWVTDTGAAMRGA